MAAILTTVAAVAAGATAHPLWALFGLGGVVVTIAALSTFSAPIVTAVVSWAIDDGFVLGRHGDLALTAQAISHALTLGAVALFAATVTALIRTLRIRLRTTTIAVTARGSGAAPTRSQPIGQL